MVHIYNGILLSHKNNEIMPFAATWMDLEIITLSKVSQIKTNILWCHLYVKPKKKYKWAYLQNRNRHTDIQNKFMLTKGLLLLLLSHISLSNSVRPHRQQPTRLCHPWDSPGKNTGVGCHFLLRYMKVKSESEVTQSCPTLRDSMDSSLPGCSFHGISQGRVLEWVAIAFSMDTHDYM